MNKQICNMNWFDSVISNVPSSRRKWEDSMTVQWMLGRASRTHGEEQKKECIGQGFQVDI